MSEVVSPVSGHAVADDLGVRRRDGGPVLGARSVAPGAEEADQLGAAPGGRVRQVLVAVEAGDHVAEGGHQGRVLLVDLPLVDHVRVGESCREGRGRSDSRPAGSREARVLVRQALDRRRAGVVEGPRVREDASGEGDGRHGVNGHLAVGEDHGTVRKVRLEEAERVVAPDLVEGAQDVGVVSSQTIGSLSVSTGTRI